MKLDEVRWALLVSLVCDKWTRDKECPPVINQPRLPVSYLSNPTYKEPGAGYEDNQNAIEHMLPIIRTSPGPSNTSN